MSNTVAVFRRFFGVILLPLLLVVSGNSQSSTDGLTPPALTPGTPTGTYALSDLDNINFFNGNLNFHLPLVKVAGRGGAQMPVVLKLEQRWRIEEHAPCSPCGTFFYPTYNWWTPRSVGYGPGFLDHRVEVDGTNSCPDNLGSSNKTLLRLTFTTSDGTEYELRDKLTNGQPIETLVCFPAPFRGKEFVTADGTSATYISDDDIYDSGQGVWSGYLLLRDGTRFRIINGGLIAWMQDRNGNRLSYSYNANGQVTVITDSLGRQVTFAYDLQDGFPGQFDKITYTGFEGATKEIRVRKRNLTHALRSDQVLKTPYELFPTLTGSSNSNFFNPQVITAVILPNGRSYDFYYNSYGELARAVLPTGGAIEYDWGEGVKNVGAGGVWGPNIYRRVIERRTYPNGATGSAFEGRITYSRQEEFAGVFQSPINLGYVIVDQIDSAGVLQARSKHYFYGYGSYVPFNPFDPAANTIHYTPWKFGREYQIEFIDRTDGVTVMRRETHTIQQREEVFWWGGSDDDEPPNDPRVTLTVLTWNQTNQVSKQTFSYDQFNNRTVVAEFDYGIGAPPTHPKRRTETDYVVVGETNSIDYTGTAVHLRSLTKEHRIYSVNTGGGATLESKTHFFYDQSPLTARTGIIGWQDPLTTARGNLTTTN